ncbi:MAG: hypothetical protein LC739_04950, partial [Actinobacteria bacterium]|nr:hypothetical protein [Actinomycetota bacterium]
SPVAEQQVRRIYETAALGGSTSRRGDLDPHRLHRIPIQRADAIPFFAAKVRRGQRTEEWARRLLRGYRGL